MYIYLPDRDLDSVFLLYLNIFYKFGYHNNISRLTVVSREAKKKQHACASSGPRDHYSELFTQMAALKF